MVYEYSLMQIENIDIGLHLWIDEVDAKEDKS